MTTSDSNETPVVLTVTEVVGPRIRFHRRLAEITQEQLAEAARDAGLGWSRPTVADIESGKRPLRSDELLAVPFLLHAAIKKGATWRAGIDVTLMDLLSPGPNAVLAITDHIHLTNEQVTEWLGNTLPPIEELKEFRNLHPKEGN